MSIIDDILKGIPDNARLRAFISELQSENSVLKKENEELKAQVDDLTVKGDLLKDGEKEILKIIIKGGAIRTIDISLKTGIPIEKIEYHLDSLISRNFARAGAIAANGNRLPAITESGRALVIENELV